MLHFEKPDIKVKEFVKDAYYGKFVIEPLARGFGITLGNSLRRVLLSSLPGFAITTVNIDGVLHEFTAISGVIEDVPMIVLNLKQLVLELVDDGLEDGQLTPEDLEEKVVTLELHKSGEGPVTAADIEPNSAVRIVNPDLHICTLAKGGKISMRMTARLGRGYVSHEENKKYNQEVGDIAIDSIFTPIKRVQYEVEKTVDQSDRLILEVYTNGSVEPQEAIALAAKILMDHLSVFVELNDKAKLAEFMVESEEDTKNKILEMNIEELDLSVRSYNCLKRAGINTVQELVNQTEEDLMKVRNLGRKSLKEVKDKLAELNLSLRRN
ncbi:MAG TPA: DNA-directed RNA polymerase subunit alpha [Haloplasmataceae bacterium]